MRTTITLDDDTAALVHEHVRQRGRSLEDVVDDALKDALGGGSSGPSFTTPVVDMGEPLVPLDRALSLAAELEDEELLRRAAQRR